MGYARSLEFGDEIEDDFTEYFLTLASLRLGVRSFFASRREVLFCVLARDPSFAPWRDLVALNGRR